MTSLRDRLGSALAGRYSIERQIGEGAMGTVFLANDLRHDRRVAIKVFRPEVSELMGAERFLQEIRFAARLDHPHILMLIDSGDADDLLYYVMPFVDGETLRVVHRDIKPENILLANGHAKVADFGIARGASDVGERLTMTGMSI